MSIHALFITLLNCVKTVEYKNREYRIELLD